MVETFAKNLKNKFPELIKKILTEAKIESNEEDYELRDGDGGFLNLKGRNPQEEYIFNFNLILNKALSEKKDIILEKMINLKKDKLFQIIDSIAKETIEEFNNMSESNFKEELKNHFEKNKNNIEKYLKEEKSISNLENEFYDDFEYLIDKTKKENFNFNFLLDWNNTFCDNIILKVKNFDEI